MGTKRSGSAIVARGYQVRPAQNGGWIVNDIPSEHCFAGTIGAFTNADDLLQFLAEQHAEEAEMPK